MYRGPGSREDTPSVAWIKEYYYICTAYKAIIFKPFSTKISNLCNEHNESYWSWAALIGE